jgi:5-formyltetrahydrofolate cyclo-ligase
LRREGYAARNAQENKDEVSDAILARVVSLPEYVAANTAMWYVDIGSEVRTRRRLDDALTSGKRIVVPYCTVDDRGVTTLGLWRLTSMDELAPGKWSILEPPSELRGKSGNEVDPSELDVVLTPGVAFTRDGARIGSGQGYYDRLFVALRPEATVIGLAYECQLFPNLAVDPHDVYMDKVVTEKGVYQGRGRRFT